MKSRRFHIIVTGLLVCAALGAFIVFSHMVRAAGTQYDKLKAGGGLPEKYLVNGIDVSGKNIPDAIKVVRAALGKRQIELCGAKVNISQFTDINVVFGSDDISIWDYVLNRGDVAAKVTYKIDKNRLDKMAKELGDTEPEDAVIRFINGEAVIVPEVYGNILSVTEKTIEELELAMTYGTEPDLEQFYKKPEVTGADLEEDLEKARAWNRYRLDVTTDGFHIKTVNVSRHLKWNGKNVVLSGKWLRKKIKQLADELDTYGKTRNFVTHSGKNIKVPGGTMGWKLNQKKTKASVCEAVKRRKQSTELVWDNKGALFWDSDAGNDIGDTYVEVSINKQRVWYYRKGKVRLESSIVTGLPTEERHTKTGVHHILYKQRDRILRGSANAWSSFVNYWMPFTLDGQGLHDANWRSRFGGPIYTYNGSHGCVNLPAGFAAQLYGKIKTGTPVIVY